MAGNPIVLLHGWSDTSSSFRRLGNILAEATEQPTTDIWLGDYISLDDDVTMADIVNALQRAWDDSALPAGPNSVDAVVHSTGALVIRDWMHTYYTASDRRPPIQNLVMLAPANFGSPLAHKGRSIIGRVLKGTASSGFETGAQVLKALEMASEYTWQLAARDRFEANAFSTGGVRCTVIVGNTGYPGIRGLANENGSDGTVYVATANLECARVDVLVERSGPRPGDPGEDTIRLRSIESSKGPTALLVLNNFDHARIIGRERLPATLLESIVRGLSVSARDFPGWRADCEARTSALYERFARRRNPEKHAFQNTVFRVQDDQGASVLDYVVEFYGEFDADRDRWARVFNREISGKTHPYGDNPAYRSFMIDVSRLAREIDEIDEQLRISFSAVPDVMEDDAPVGYKTTGVHDIGGIRLSAADIARYFQPNRTLFVNVRLPRYQDDEVVRLNAL